MKQFNFQSENLVVDWISISFPRFKLSDKPKLIQFLQDLGYNPYERYDDIKLSSDEIFDPFSPSQFSFFNSRNRTILCFPGSNAQSFYQLLQQKDFCWELFQDGELSRVDLCFENPIKPKDSSDILLFFKDFQLYLEGKGKFFSYQINQHGPVLRIGNRRSHHFLRVYSNQRSLRFEYEIKGIKTLTHSHKLLVSNRFEEFEHTLTRQFLSRFGNVLPLQNRFVDWLVITLRPLRKAFAFPKLIKLDYLKDTEHDDGRLDTYENKTNFVHFLQFLRFTNSLPYESQPTYRKITFPLQQFFRYQNPSSEYMTSYQRTKIRIFLETLQQNSLVQSFSNSHFRSIVTIPKVELSKSENNLWMVEVLIAHELFDYAFPFLIPDIFEFEQRPLTKIQFSILFEILHVFASTRGLEKTIHVQRFIDDYSHKSAISNQQKTNIKQYFIRLIQTFYKFHLLDNTVLILNTEDQRINLDILKLQTKHITPAFTVYEKLLIP